MLLPRAATAPTLVSLEAPKLEREDESSSVDSGRCPQAARLNRLHVKYIEELTGFFE
jgi:hypothetical protein